MFSFISITFSYSGPACGNELEDDTACSCWEEHGSGLELWDCVLLMQWYTRTPAKNPIMKITTEVLAIAIPSLALAVRGSRAPVGEEK